MLLAWLATSTFAHDYILDAGPTLEGQTPVFGLVAHDRERERRESRPETLTRLDRLVEGTLRPVEPTEGSWGTVPEADVATVVVYENAGAAIELPWPRFRDYVASEGDARMLAVVDSLAREPQHEHYRRSLKLLLGVEHEGWDVVAGLPLEIVPLRRPGSRRRMRVRLLASGRPVAGARVRAFPLAGHADDDAVVATTDDDGVATLRLRDRSLDWVYAAVTMTHEPDRDPAWHSIWTTLRTR